MERRALNLFQRRTCCASIKVMHDVALRLLSLSLSLSLSLEARSSKLEARSSKSTFFIATARLVSGSAPSFFSSLVSLVKDLLAQAAAAAAGSCDVGNSLLTRVPTKV